MTRARATAAALAACVLTACTGSHGERTTVAANDRYVTVYEQLHPAVVLLTMKIPANDPKRKGEWDDALSFFDRGREAYLRAGDVVNAGYGALNIADILIDQGRASEAEPGLHELLELWRSVRYPEGIAGALLNLGRCALRRGDYADALSLFEEAKQSSLALGEAAGIEADAWLAECLIHNREPAAALKIIDAAMRRDVGTGGSLFSAKLHRLRGWAFAGLRRLDEAGAELQRSLAVARTRSSLYDIALALEASATISRLAGDQSDDAGEREAVELLARLGVRGTNVPDLHAAAAGLASAWSSARSPAVLVRLAALAASGRRCRRSACRPGTRRRRRRRPQPRSRGRTGTPRSTARRRRC